MKYLLLFLVFLSNSALAESDWLAHKVIVPIELANGRTTEAFSGHSDIERYVSNFEQTWWKVLRAFANGSPDWTSHEHFSICSGTPAASNACNDGYQSATKKLKELIKKHGETKVREYVEERLTPNI